MAGIGEIVALAKGLGGSGGGGSSGGVLVVTDTDGTLDKTWQEIHDAMKTGGAVYDGGDDDGVYIIDSAYIDNDYVVHADAGEWHAQSASGYPVSI